MSAAIAQIDSDTYVSIAEIAGDDYSEDFLKAIDYALQFRQQDRPQSMSEWIATFDRRSKSRDKVSKESPSVLENQINEAKTGNPVAQSKLAFMYAKGIHTEKDEALAVNWYMEAAENNHVNAQYNLALMYAKGRGVEKNFNEALRWYTLAATQGDIVSQYALGEMHLKGIGTDKNHKLAFNWYRKAAEQDYTNAEYKLAELLQKGKGVDEDFEAAYK